nr:hypothetical protein [Tanacetum cinerariifolium]
MGQDRQMQMVEGNGKNQFRQYVGHNNLRVQNIRNQNGLIGVPGNANQNLNENGNLVAARAEGNAVGQNGNQIRCYNCRGVGHFARNCTVRPRRRDAAYLQIQLLIAQKEEEGIQLKAEEFNLMAAAADLDEIEEVNKYYILMANLQQASTSGTQTDKAPVYDSDGSDEVHDYENCNDNEIFNMFTQEEQYTELLEPIPEPHQVLQNDNNVISEVTSVKQSGEIVEQHPVNVEKKQTHNWSSSAHQELHKIVKDENFPIINQVDARVQNFEIQFLKEVAKFVRDFKSLAKKADDSLAKHKALELEIKCLLRAVVSQDIMSVVQKACVVDTSNLQTELERMFRINPFKTSREEKHVPNVVRASARTKPITVSQPPIITKKDVNSDSNGLSSTGIDNTKIKRPQPRSNTKNDRVPSESKSSRSKNRGVEVEEHHRNLLLSKNTKHMSYACNNIKLDSQNVISKVVCAMCKQCLISVNRDVCLRNYVNGKTSRGKKQKANVSIKEKQKKHQSKVKKMKKVGFIERLATPKASKTRFFLRWSPTGRLFDLKGKIIESSESESQSDCSNGNNACTSNTLEPKIKQFPMSTSLLGSFFFFSSIAMQTSGSDISILLTVAFIFRQWEVPSGSGNF